MITPEHWEVLQPFRQSIEEEYNRSVVQKPERLPAYSETIEVLKDALDRYGIDQTDAEQVFCFASGVSSSLAFVSQYFATVCSDQHMMGHLSEAAMFLGYLVRELCFAEGIPTC